MEEVKNTWGGKRTGAGRPVGTTKALTSIENVQTDLK